MVSPTSNVTVASLSSVSTKGASVGADVIEALIVAVPTPSSTFTSFKVTVVLLIVSDTVTVETSVVIKLSNSDPPV